MTTAKIRLLGAALMVVSVISVFYGYLSLTTGDCVAHGSSSNCGSGPGHIFIELGVVEVFANLIVFWFSKVITSAVAGRGIRRNGLDATATLLALEKFLVVPFTVLLVRLVRLRMLVVPADGSSPYEAQLEKLVS